MAYALILVGLGVLGVGFAALIRGRIRWFRIVSRRAAVVVIVIGLIVLSVGAALFPRPTARTAASTPTPTARSTPSSISTTATTTPKPTAEPSSKNRAAGGESAAAPGAIRSKVWDALAECESSGDWAINTGNGLYGGLQMDRSTWLDYGGRAYAPLPSKATREQQILVAEKVRADRGFSPWSGCARELGLL